MKKIVVILLSILCSIVQISFLPSINALAGLNILLIISIFLLFYDSPNLYCFIIAGGLAYDIYSSLFFPSVTISILATILFSRLLFKNSFTNQSFYSLVILSFISLVVYNLIKILLLHAFYFLRLSEIILTLNKLYFFGLISQFIVNLTFIIILYVFQNFFNRKKIIYRL